MEIISPGESLLHSQISISRPTTGHSSRPTSKHSQRISSSASSRTSQPIPPLEAPPHLRPTVKSAVRRWKRAHEINMFDRLIQAKDERREKDRQTRELVAKIARRIPIDILANEWLNTERATIETREFLIENILPCLIVGLEKLLIEVYKLNLHQEDVLQPNFNPLNFLAQYLLRNNPRYSNFSEASPYIRGLRQISEELRQEIYQFKNNKLAKLKAEARKRRELRDQEEKNKKAETNRRIEACHQIYDAFLLENEIKIDKQAAVSSVQSFSDVYERLPPELKQVCVLKTRPEISESPAKKLGKREFTDELMKYCENMNKELFDKFVDHMLLCANAYKSLLITDERRYLFANVFVDCDLDQIGLLDRPRIIELFTNFYGEAPAHVKKLLQNPKKMPLRDIMREIKRLERKQRRSELKKKKKEFEAGLISEAEYEECVKRIQEDQEDDFEEDDIIEEEEDVVEEPPADEGTGAEKSEEDNKAGDVNQSNVSESEIVDDQEVSASPVNQENDEQETDQDQEQSTFQKESSLGSTTELHEDDGNEKEEQSELETTDEVNNNAAEELQGNGEVIDTNKEKKDVSVVIQVEKDEVTQLKEEVKSPQKTLSFVKEKTNISTASFKTQPSQSSAYDEKTVNQYQFIYLTENFLSNAKASREVMEELAEYIRDGYQETEAERHERIARAQKEAQRQLRNQLLDQLFELWDNDGSGYLEIEEVEGVINKYKHASHKRGVASAKRIIFESTPNHDYRLTKREFRDFVFVVAQRVHQEDNIEVLIDFMKLSIERSRIEKARGEARRKFLDQIITAAHIGGGSLESIFRATFQALFKDAVAHGEGKNLSSSISLLEVNLKFPERGRDHLRCVAATPNDAHFMVGKILYRDMPNTSFKVVDSGQVEHLTRLSNNPSVQFWNPQRKADNRSGSLVVVPLKDNTQRVFGVLTVDTLNDPNSASVHFAPHEIKFYEGIAKSFSIAYHYADLQRKMTRVSESAMAWLCRHVECISSMSLYVTERDPKDPTQDFALRRLIASNHRGDITTYPSPERISRGDNVFRSYLFSVIDTSEVVLSDAYGERHVAFPIRDLTNRADIVIDIGIGDLKVLPRLQEIEINKIVGLLQIAYLELQRVSKGEENSLDPKLSRSSNADEMFNELLLTVLSEKILKLDAQVYSELHSYQNPPVIVQKVSKAILTLLYPKRALSGEFDSWDVCRPLIGPDLALEIESYSPQQQAISAPLRYIQELLLDIPYHDVKSQGSEPTEHLFNWLLVCITLIEHTIRVLESQNKNTSLHEEEKEEELELLMCEDDAQEFEDEELEPSEDYQEDEEETGEIPIDDEAKEDIGEVKE